MPPRPRRRSTTSAASQAKAKAVTSAKALAPDLEARLGSTPATKFRGDPDVFGRLVADHDRHRALLAMIDATAPRSPDRKRLFEELVRELKGHAAAEEQALWSSLLRNPDTTDDARHAIAEHHDLDKRLADLAARDLRGRGWLRRFTAMRDEYLHHLREEEQEQFVAADRVLTPADRRHLHRVFVARKRAEKAAAQVERKLRHKA